MRSDTIVTMKINSEAELIEVGATLGKELNTPAVVELVGDVGAGKTTFTRGLAQSLGVSENITSPSFTIAKRYAFTQQNSQKTLVHYDFYRLPDPGIMYEEIAEEIANPDSIVVVEWGGDVADLLPKKHIMVRIKVLDDGGREVEINRGTT